MKKVLAVVLAAAFVSITAAGAFAQIPHVQWYYDNTFTQASANCDGSQFQVGYVAAVNFNAFISSIEYTVSYPATMQWVLDSPVSEFQLNIGNTPSGVASAWSLPLDCFNTAAVMRVVYSWLCDDCQAGPQPIIVLPHPTGRLSYFRFPDNTRFDAIGMTSLVCGDPIPVEETSWGKVKALYE